MVLMRAQFFIITTVLISFTVVTIILFLTQPAEITITKLQSDIYEINKITRIKDMINEANQKYYSTLTDEAEGYTLINITNKEGGGRKFIREIIDLPNDIDKNSMNLKLEDQKINFNIIWLSESEKTGEISFYLSMSAGETKSAYLSYSRSKKYYQKPRTSIFGVIETDSQINVITSNYEAVINKSQGGMINSIIIDNGARVDYSLSGYNCSQGFISQENAENTKIEIINNHYPSIKITASRITGELFTQTQQFLPDRILISEYTNMDEPLNCNYEYRTRFLTLNNNENGSNWNDFYNDELGITIINGEGFNSSEIINQELILTRSSSPLNNQNLSLSIIIHPSGAEWGEILSSEMNVFTTTKNYELNSDFNEKTEYLKEYLRENNIYGELFYSIQEDKTSSEAVINIPSSNQISEITYVFPDSINLNSIILKQKDSSQEIQLSTENYHNNSEFSCSLNSNNTALILNLENSFQINITKTGPEMKAELIHPNGTTIMIRDISSGDQTEIIEQESAVKGFYTLLLNATHTSSYTLSSTTPKIVFKTPINITNSWTGDLYLQAEEDIEELRIQSYGFTAGTYNLSISSLNSTEFTQGVWKELTAKPLNIKGGSILPLSINSNPGDLRINILNSGSEYISSKKIYWINPEKPELTLIFSNLKGISRIFYSRNQSITSDEATDLKVDKENNIVNNSYYGFDLDDNYFSLFNSTNWSNGWRTLTGNESTDSLGELTLLEAGPLRAVYEAKTSNNVNYLINFYSNTNLIRFNLKSSEPAVIGPLWTVNGDVDYYYGYSGKPQIGYNQLLHEINFNNLTLNKYLWAGRQDNGSRYALIIERDQADVKNSFNISTDGVFTRCTNCTFWIIIDEHPHDYQDFITTNYWNKLITANLSVSSNKIKINGVIR